MRDRLVENGALKTHGRCDRVRAESPAEAHRAPQGSALGARRVDEHARKHAANELGLARPCDLQSPACGARSEVCRARPVDVTGDDLATSRREGERLSAAARAEVQDRPGAGPR